MNKQNLNKNISFILNKQNKQVSKQSTNQLSFRHLNNKSFLNNQSRIISTISPLQTKRTKTLSNKLDLSVVNTEPSESLINLNHNNLNQAFQIERQSLINTIKMYKEQVDLLTKDKERLRNDVSKYKSNFTNVDCKMRQKMKQNDELVKKVAEYQNMLPKIIELQRLQEKILKQNNILKDKIRIQQVILSNVINIAKTDHSHLPVSEKILALTQPYLSGFSKFQTA